jgi:hexosaminidase
MHLTDDQGWRIEIKKYPELTADTNVYREPTKHDEVCVERAVDNELFEIDKTKFKEVNGKQLYGGFFTQEDIKEIIQYADERCIDVLPEIDMPGHFKGALDVFPEMTCFNKSAQATSNPNRSLPLCPSKEISYEIIEGIIEEVAALFPFEYIHVGSDEVSYETWEVHESCQELIKKEKLSGVKELQSYFNKRAE